MKKALVAGLFLSAGVAASAQTVLLETGFESPFVAGPLRGQQSFLGAGSATAAMDVQSATVFAGTQAVEMRPGTAALWIWKDTPFAMGGSTTELTVEWRMRTAAPFAIANFGYGMDLYSSTVDRFVAVFADDTGEVICVRDNDGLVETATGVILSDDRWYAFKVVLDFTSRTFDLFIDGTQVVNGETFNAIGGDTFNDADLWVLGRTGADDKAFLDDLKVTVGGGAPSCYADCDTSTGVGVLDIFDFLCFQNQFASSAAYACECDTSTGPGVCDIFDFLCF